MSDFDKEAEREKLRKKYERDKEEREATQRMSDLLLKGATMTNMHCGTCGDPLFKQDGTTFCPSCHGNPDAVQGTDLEAQPAEQSGDEQRGTAQTQAGDTGSDASTATQDDAGSEATPTARGESETTARSESDTTARTADSESATSAETEGQEQSRETATSQADASARSDRAERGSQSPADTDRSTASASSSSSSLSPTSPSPSQPSQPAIPSDRDSPQRSGDRRSGRASRATSGDLETAHASLVAALEKWADEAAAADDPRYARECLEAAREASEALNALR